MSLLLLESCINNLLDTITTIYFKTKFLYLKQDIPLSRPFIGQFRTSNRSARSINASERHSSIRLIWNPENINKMKVRLRWSSCPLICKTGAYLISKRRSAMLIEGPYLSDVRLSLSNIKLLPLWYMVICTPEPPIIFIVGLFDYLIHLELELVRFLISTTIWDVIIIKKKYLLEAVTYLDQTVKLCSVY